MCWPAPTSRFLAAIGLAAAGELSHALGTYSVTAEGNLTPSGMPRSLLEHLAPLGLGLGIAPFILAVAWPLTALVRERTRDQHAYASVAVVTVVALLFEVDVVRPPLRREPFARSVPLLSRAAAADLVYRDGAGRDWPRWAVFGAGALLAMAFAFMPVVRYDKFNVDSPVALLNEPLLGIAGSVNGARALLAFVTIAVTLLLMVGRRVALAVVVVGALALPALAGGAFTRLLAHDGTSGRPITVDQSVVFDWIDRKVGNGSSVTMLPYPFLYGSYWENVAYWWNVEFWNASIRHAAVYEDAFTGTPETFPTTSLGVDRRTGRINVSPSRLRRTGRRRDEVPPAGRVLDRIAAPRWSDAAAVAGRLGRVRLVSRRLDDSEGNGHGQGLRPPGSPRRSGGTSRSTRGRRRTSPPAHLLSLERDDWRAETTRTERAGNSRCASANGFADVHVDAPLTRRFTATRERAVVRQLRPLRRRAGHRHRARRRGRPLLSRVSVGGGPDDLDLKTRLGAPFDSPNCKRPTSS